MTTEKICFRYDGSEEAKKCIEWLNSHIDHLKNDKLSGDAQYYYTNKGEALHEVHEPLLRSHRLVPPAEFLRIVTGESEWTPKYGEEVEVSDNGECWNKAFYVGINPHPESKDTHPYCAVFINNQRGGGGAYRQIRPIRKSLREELVSEFDRLLLKGTDTEEVADRIIELVKERKWEI